MTTKAERSGRFTSGRLEALGADATLRLWVRVEHGEWVWADLADFAERTHARAEGIASPDLFMQAQLSPDRYWVEWPDGTRLAGDRLDQPSGTWLPEGVFIWARRSEPWSWYRPLVVWGLVAVRPPGETDPLPRLVRALGLSEQELTHLAGRYTVEPLVLHRRLLDLVVYLEQTKGGPALWWLDTPWSPGRRSRDSLLRTPLVAIQQGRLALVEHIYAEARIQPTSSRVP